MAYSKCFEARIADIVWAATFLYNFYKLHLATLNILSSIRLNVKLPLWLVL